MLGCGSCWVSDSSVFQEIVQGSLPTHHRPRCRRLKGLGLLNQLFLRQVKSWLFLSSNNSSVSVLLFASDQAFLDGNIRTIKQQLDHIWIRQVKTLRNRINQLVPGQRNLITSLRNEPIGLGCKDWRKTLGDAIGRTRSFNPKNPYDWLNVFGNATLSPVAVPRLADVRRMLPKRHL